MKKWTSMLAAGAVECALPNAAHAAAWCAFKVDLVGITPQGYVNAALISQDSGVGHGWGFCSVHGTVNATDGYGAHDITSDDCKAILSVFMTAKASNTVVHMNFVSLPDCSASSLPVDGWPISTMPDNIILG